MLSRAQARRRLLHTAASAARVSKLKIVSGIAQELASTIEGWSLDDVSLVLAVLPRLRMKEIVDESSVQRCGERVRNRRLVADMRRFLELAHAAYAPVKFGQDFCQVVSNAEFCAGQRDADLSSYTMSHFISVCHESKSIVVSIRGSYSAADCFIACHAVPQPFMSGFAHKGAAIVAERMLQPVADTIRALMHKHAGFQPVVVGHSLGGGVAVLLAFLLRDEFSGTKCYAYNAPPVVSRDMALSCQQFVWSLTNGDDLVTRLHLSAIESLRAELHALDWKAALRDQTLDDISRSRVVEILGSTRAGAKHTVSSVVSSVRSWCAQVEQSVTIWRDVVAAKSVQASVNASPQSRLDARDVLRSSLEHLRDVDVANSASRSSASSASSGVSVSGDDHLSAGDAEKRYRWLRGVTQRIRAEVIAALSVPAASQPQSMQDVSRDLFPSNALLRIRGLERLLGAEGSRSDARVQGMAVDDALSGVDAALPLRQARGMERLQFCVAGNSFHLAITGDRRAKDWTLPGNVDLWQLQPEVATAYFGRIPVTPFMLKDHAAKAIEASLQQLSS